MRLSAALTVCAALIGAAPLAAQERAQVRLFRYASTNTDETRTAFLDFEDLMVAKLPRLASELDGQGLSVDPARLARLSLWPVPADDGSGIADPVDLIPDLAAQRNHWTQTGALALLTGRVKRLSPGELAIRSSFFLGDLGRAYGTETVDVELKFTDTSYDTTNDSHSVAVLYALALELLPGCGKVADVYVLLSQADLRAKEVGAEDAALGKSLGDLVSRGFDAAHSECPSQ